MRPPPRPPDEAERIETLQRYRILDTPPERAFDDLNRLAAAICETPISLITFIDRERQWIKSRIGIDFSEIPRDRSLCAHTILQSHPFVVPDAASDPAFADHPWVVSDPRIRFYAGVPLRTPEGHALGAVCVMDRIPRALNSSQLDGLQTIARETMTLLDLQREITQRKEAEEKLRASEERYRLLFENNPHPMWVFDLETLAFLAVNEAAIHHYGYRREEFLSMTIKALALPEDIPALMKELPRISTRIGSAGIWRNRKKDGTMIEVEFTADILSFSGRRAKLVLANDVTERRAAERALKKTEEKNRALLEAVPDMMFQISREGTILDFIPAKGLAPALPPAELPGKRLDEIFPQDVAREALQFALRAIETGTVQMFEHPLLKANQRCNYEVRMIAIGHDEVLAIVRDITERKRAEEALRRSEERFQLVTRAANDAIWDWDLTTDALWWNEGVKTMFGYRAEEVEPHVDWWRERLHPEDKGRVLADIEAAFGKGEHFWSDEYRFRRGSGTYGVILDRGYIVRDHHGRPLRMIGAMMDITQRKEAEAALAAEKEQLAVTLRSIGDGVITTDVEGKVVLMNNVAETLTGWTQEEALGRPLDRIFQIRNEKSGQALQNPAETALEKKAPVGLPANTMLVARDGAERIITDSSAPIRDREGRILGAVLVFRDVTQKKRMEEDLLRTGKLEAIGLLAGGIAHDFNNILTAILGNLSLVKTSIDPLNPLHRRLGDAEAAALRARDLAQQLLTFAKGGAPIKKPASLKALLEESIRFALRGSNVAARFFIQEDLRPAEIDAGQISQVIHNLIINAQQAMPKGGIIEVRAENVAVTEREKWLPLPPGEYVRLSIRDFGIGIPKEYLSRIFDPYFTTKQRGSGLGLPTSYSIVKKHEGYMTVHSELGAGSTFSIYLPASSRPVAPERRSEAPLRGQGRILIMDDEPAVREVAGEILSLLGYRVEYAEEGEEALRRYREALAAGAPFDLVIMDLTIPGKMGGKETIQKLREIDPRVKAIVSSGYSNDPIMSDFSKYGFKGVIAKPYQLEELSKVVHDVITESSG